MPYLPCSNTQTWIKYLQIIKNRFLLELENCTCFLIKITPLSTPKFCSKNHTSSSKSKTILKQKIKTAVYSIAAIIKMMALKSRFMHFLAVGSEPYFRRLSGFFFAKSKSSSVILVRSDTIWLLAVSSACDLSCMPTVSVSVKKELDNSMGDSCLILFSTRCSWLLI